jgi:hypothetical protein
LFATRSAVPPNAAAEFHHELPLASERALQEGEKPPRAIPLDQVSRRLSGTIDPEQPSHVPSDEEFEEAVRQAENS